MPPQATKDWLSLLEQEAKNRGIYVNTDIDGRIFHFHLGNNPGIVGKVRYSEAKSRNYENEQGQKHIWHRYNRETEALEQGLDRKVANVTLDVWEKDEYDPARHHFIFLTERLLQEETYSQGDQKIWIEGDGIYSGPLAKNIDDWDTIFSYATGEESSHPRADSADDPESETEKRGPSTNGDTSGSVLESERTEVRVSNDFRQQVYDRFDNHCLFSNIERSELLTISHILSRSENPELAEDIGNVLLLDWNHHMAFDAGLWTFDESGRVWIKPEFNTESKFLRQSLLDRHGEKLRDLKMVADEYIDRHNNQLDWWPPS